MFKKNHLFFSNINVLFKNLRVVIRENWNNREGQTDGKPVDNYNLIRQKIVRRNPKLQLWRAFIPVYEYVGPRCLQVDCYQYSWFPIKIISGCHWCSWQLKRIHIINETRIRFRIIAVPDPVIIKRGKNMGIQCILKAFKLW